MDVGTSSFILFIILMAAIIYFNRKRLEIQGITVMTRTNRFKKNVYSVANHHKKFWKIYFNLGIAVTVLTMILGTIFIGYSAYDALAGSGASAFGLVIPYPTSDISFDSGLVKVPIWIFLLAIPVILIPHELSHGLALAMNKLKIKSMGLVAFLIIPGAFVEPDEEELKKAKKKHRLQVYCAGSFSNIVTGILFILLLHLFVSGFYAPAGVYFDLPATRINTSEIQDMTNLSNGYLELTTTNNTYLTLDSVWPEQKNSTEIIVLENLPAARNNLSGGLKRIGETTTLNASEVSLAISRYNPGDTVEIETSNGIHNIALADKNGTAYLGVKVYGEGSIYSILNPLNGRYYEAKNPEHEAAVEFIAQLISFIIAVCIGVAIFNMLPAKPLDGGWVLEVLTNEKVAKISSYLILIALLANFGAAIF